MQFPDRLAALLLSRLQGKNPSQAFQRIIQFGVHTHLGFAVAQYTRLRAAFRLVHQYPTGLTRLVDPEHQNG